MATLFDENRFESEIDSKVKSIVKNELPKTEYYRAIVVRQGSDGVWWVRLDGNDEATPVLVNKVDMSVGDVVTVTIDDHVSIADGNLTSPPMSANNAMSYVDDVVARNISAVTAKIGYLEADTAKIGYAQIEDADITNARIQTLTYDVERHSERIFAAEGAIDTLEANSLTANSATITNLQAQTAKLVNVTANDLEAATGYIADLTADNVSASDIIADHAAVGSLDANYAQVNMANVNNAWVQNGTIKDGAITNAMINSVSANKLTAGTIDASDINVTNLRADTLIVNKVNGQPVIGGYVAVDSNANGYSSMNPQAQGWYEISNGQMVLTTDTAVNSAKAYYSTSTSVSLYDQTYIDSMEDTLNDRIDGAIETHSGTVVPTLVNYPYTDWYDTTTSPVTDNRAEHVGDLYYVVNEAADEDGYCYRFYYDQTSSQYMWVLIKDSDVTAALGRITDLETFESTTTSWISDTDEGLETIRTNHTTLSGVVDKTVVESIQLWYTKADTTAPSKPYSDDTTSHVTSTSTDGNGWRTVVPAWNASYPCYYYCWQYKLADGKYRFSAVVRDLAMEESQAQGRLGVANAATADGKAVSAQTTANANIKSTVQLWYTSNSTTPPSKPYTDGSSSHVTSTSTSHGVWTTVVPTYDSSYPKYHYCYEQQRGDGKYQWSAPVYDAATTDAMATSKSALPASTFTTFESTTFKNVKDTVDENSSSITSLSETVQSVGSGAVNLCAYGTWVLGTTNESGKPAGTSWSALKVNSTTRLRLEELYTISPGNYSVAIASGYQYFVLWFDDDGYLAQTVGWTSNATLTVPSGATACGILLKKSDNSTVTVEDAANSKLRLSYSYADASALTTLSNTVNTVSQTATSNSSKISQLTTTLGTNADGTTKTGDIVHRTSAVEQDLSGITTRVSATEAQIKGQFATSSTGASTAAKTATITPTNSSWARATGSTVTVKFTTANTAASPTLNINSTGAASIRNYAGSALTEAEYKWPAGAAMTFTFDGTYWRIQDSTELTRLSSAESSITQNADKIAMVVASGSTASSVQLTPNAITAISNNVTIKDSSGSSTVIEGGKIKANSLTIGEIATATQADILNSNVEAVLGSFEPPYTEVEWVESNGKQFVYLDWKPPLATWGFEADFLSKNAVGTSAGAWNASTNVNGYGTVFGTRNASGVNQAYLSSYSNGLLRSGNSNISGHKFKTDKTRQTIKLIGTTLTATDGTTTTVTRGSETANSPYSNMVVFALHTGLRRAASGNVEQPGSARIYSLKFYESTTLKVDLVGAIRKADGCTGLWDKVSGHFYPAPGMTYGSVVGDLGTAPTVAQAAKLSDINAVVDNLTDRRMWRASVPDLDKLEDGQKIAVTPMYTVVKSYQTTELAGWDDTGENTYVYLKLTLANNEETDWIPCYYMGATRLTTHYGAGIPILFTYRENMFSGATDTASGSSIMRAFYADANYYTDSNDNARYIQYYNNIKAKSAIANAAIAVGDASGYAQAASGVSFDLSYPMLWTTAAIAADAVNYANVYTQTYDRDLSTVYTGFSGTALSIVYLVGTVSGNTFTISSPVVTCSVPNSEDGKAYIPIGRLGSQSTGANYFNFAPGNTPSLYAYKDGMFGPVSIREASAAAKTATNYITQDSSGIKIHDAGDTSNYVHITSSGTAVYKDVDGTSTDVAYFGETARIGVDESSRFEMSAGQLAAYDEDGDLYFSVSNDGLVYGGKSAASEDVLDGLIEGLSTSSYFTANDDGTYSFTVDSKLSEIGDVKDEVDTISKFVRIDGSTLTLGRSDHPVCAVLSESGLVFYPVNSGQIESENPIASLVVEGSGASAAGVLVIHRAVVVNEMRVGSWVWTPRANGNLALKWTGA